LSIHFENVAYFEANCNKNFINHCKFTKLFFERFLFTKSIFLENHQVYMYRALKLAKLGAANVAPNPMVGSVIVHENEIIGEGFHQKYGEAHAEVNAINSVIDKSKLSLSTVYVSLEPCCHHGKTPPCADLLIENKVKKVVICNQDPNPMVAGKGIEKLRNSGIEVEIGILAKEGHAVNKRFFTFIEKKRPYIILKWAQTADGFIAGEGGKQIQISNEFSKKLVHKMRAENAAIMVATNTAINDNPNLTTRNWAGQNPVRILIDKQLRFKNSMNVFNDESQTLIYNLHGNGKVANAQYVQLPENDDFLANLILDLYAKNIQSVLVEGGTKLIESFIKLGLWDEALVIVSDNKIGDGVLGPKIDFSKAEKSELLADTLYRFKN
jgi:diaminohydroxyphosphoribosylaminopyrimidine deaminase / 5-amino-6-(5-phosphoribosylamino)uracil reductase